MPLKKTAAARKTLRQALPAPPSATASDRCATHSEIAIRAYLIYLNEGCPSGRELRHWLEAEAQLLALLKNESAQSTATPARSGAK